MCLFNRLGSNVPNKANPNVLHRQCTINWGLALHERHQPACRIAATLTRKVCRAPPNVIRNSPMTPSSQNHSNHFNAQIPTPHARNIVPYLISPRCTFLNFLSSLPAKIKLWPENSPNPLCAPRQTRNLTPMATIIPSQTQSKIIRLIQISLPFHGTSPSTMHTATQPTLHPAFPLFHLCAHAS